MSLYAITDPARPWVVLFSAPTIDEIAEALRAQPEPWNLDVGCPARLDRLRSF